MIEITRVYIPRVRQALSSVIKLSPAAVCELILVDAFENLTQSLSELTVAVMICPSFAKRAYVRLALAGITVDIVADVRPRAKRMRLCDLASDADAAKAATMNAAIITDFLIITSIKRRDCRTNDRAAASTGGFLLPTAWAIIIIS